MVIEVYFKLYFQETEISFHRSQVYIHKKEFKIQNFSVKCVRLLFALLIARLYIYKSMINIELVVVGEHVMYDG